MTQEANGKIKIIWTLAGWLFIIATGTFGTALAYTWGAVSENRKEIVDVKDNIGDKLVKIFEQLGHINGQLKKNH